jgi:carboxypeptidase PM20D1
MIRIPPRLDADLVERSIENYRALVRIPTVSHIDGEGTDWAPFALFGSEIAARYPALHGELSREVVQDWALLYHWRGTTQGPAAVLMAHYDVVPADDDGWRVPPFAAEIVDVDGEPSLVARGSIDDKASLTGILEAVEHAVTEGFRPRHDVYVALTHNEEVLGDGTPAIVELLRSRGIRPRLVIDEGGIVGESILGPIDADVICIGVSEKGTGTLRLSLSAPGGHSAVPPVEEATVTLSRAVVAIHEQTITPLLSDVNRRLIQTLGPHAPGPVSDAARLLAAGDEDAAIEAFAGASLNARAMVHTIPVVTMMSAGMTANAIPERAGATVSLRIAPGDSPDRVVESIRRIVSDHGIAVDVVELRDASPVSPSDGPEWDLIVRHIRSTYGDDVVIVPYVNNGGTDSRNYTGISDNVYRFSPYRMSLAERESLHAVDERLALSSFIEGLQFYTTFVRDL